MKILSSHINSVTVFPSVAEITRLAKVSLPKGESRVAFDMLPDTLVEKSVQVKGQGKAVMGTVKIEKVFHSVESDAGKNDLMDQALNADEQLRIAMDKVQRLNKEKTFIDNIIIKVTSPNEKSKDAELDPEKWAKMISFYQEKLETLDKFILAAEKEKVKHQDESDKLKAMLSQIGNPQAKKQKFRVSVVLDVLETGDVGLELSYQVPGARWFPVYDVRVGSDKKVNLAYQAMVSQTSGEDWENADLKISTARPKVQGNLPELRPFYIEIESTSDSKVYPELAEDMHLTKRVSNRPPSGGASAPAPLLKLDEMLKQAKVTVEAGATSVTFVITGKQTVKCDGSEEKVSIFSGEFPVELKYASVPSRQPYAYLTAKVTNATEFPFLPGEANVFLDGNFVAVSKLKQVAPTEEFSLSLGIDENLRVEYKLMNEFDKEGGNLFSKKTVVKSFEYQIKLKNFKKTTEEITVWDQLPISQNELLKVQLIEPVYKEDTNELKKEEGEKLRWTVVLKPGEERVIVFKYSVEVPQELKGRVIGIDF